MACIEISAEHLQGISEFIRVRAEELDVGSVERHQIERLLLKREAMVAAFISWHLNQQAEPDP